MIYIYNERYYCTDPPVTCETLVAVSVRCETGVAGGVSAFTVMIHVMRCALAITVRTPPNI